MPHALPLPEPPPDLDALAHRVIGAAIEVHRTLGPGFLESVYEGALAIELEARGIPCHRQVGVPIVYHGHRIGDCRLDLLVDGRLVVELKSVEALAPIHLVQTISYLKITGASLGLLINFNVSVLARGVRRVVLSDQWAEERGRNRR